MNLESRPGRLRVRANHLNVEEAEIDARGAVALQVKQRDFGGLSLARRNIDSPENRPADHGPHTPRRPTPRRSQHSTLCAWPRACDPDVRFDKLRANPALLGAGPGRGRCAPAHHGLERPGRRSSGIRL